MLTYLYEIDKLGQDLHAHGDNFELSMPSINTRHANFITNSIIHVSNDELGFFNNRSFT